MKRENITLRVTKRSEPIFNQVQKINQQRPNGQFASTLLDIIELGIKSYEFGNRIVDNEIVTKPSVYETGARTVYSVFNEVVESMYSSLAGSIADLSRYEESKANPDLEKVNFYELIGQALWREKRNFNELTDAEIVIIASQLSPILKAIHTAPNKIEVEKIVQDNLQFFDLLIKKTRNKNE